MARILLVNEDNGSGILMSRLKNTTDTLGIKLMRGLAADIGGQLEIKNNNGTSVKLSIPAVQVPSNELEEGDGLRL